MDLSDTQKLWEENASAWTRLSREGYDEYRDLVNTPAFLKMLPDVKDKHGLDVGCGEGHNTRLVAGRGAKMEAIDLSAGFIRAAQEEEIRKPLGIHYQIASAQELPYPDASFDFAVSTMALMDTPDQGTAMREIHRVLKSGAFFQFSITHPCFFTPLWKWILDEKGQKLGVLCGEYFAGRREITDEWIFGSIPKELKERLPKFKTAYFLQTLSWWVNTLIQTGYTIEKTQEPHAAEATAREHPRVADTRLVAYFLHFLCRKESEHGR